MTASVPSLSLQPSSAKRWRSCKASPGFIARVADRLPEESVPPWTQEGTDAHEYAKCALRGEPLPPLPEQHIPYVNDYINFVRSKMQPNSVLFVEQKLPLPYMNGRKCTLDSAIITPFGNGYTIDVTDLKFGVGVSVEARENDQQAIYVVALLRWLIQEGLYDEFPADTLIRIVIYQPRAGDKRVVRQWNISLQHLMEYYAGIEQDAQAILADPDNQPFSPSDDACKFCPASSLCSERARVLLGALPAEVKQVVEPVLSLPDISTMDPGTLAKVVLVAKPLEKFFEDARARAFGLLENGTSVPGLKLVKGKKSRGWKNQAEAERLLRSKFDKEQVLETSLVSPAKAEQLIKPVELSTRFKNLIAEQIEEREGKPTLVPDSDPRPALEFKVEQEFTNLDDAPASSEPTDASLLE